MIWLIKQFGEEKLLTEKILTPTQEDFPISMDETPDTACAILPIIARQMDIDPASVQVAFYNDQILEITGSFGYTLYTQQDENETYSSGLYFGKEKDNFLIAIEKSQLNNPERIVATLAHELAHVKMMEQDVIARNDEYLTDLITVFFGLGIFNANVSFQQYSSRAGWSYSRQGYLTQQEWGYSLALLAYIRQEKKPDWVKFLSTNIQSDFKKSEMYIYVNTDKVLI
jgi:hypothetical protein